MSNSQSLEVNRGIEIIKNTLTDTVLLGLAVVPAGYIGEFRYLRVSDSVVAPFDPNLDISILPKTKTICINLYQRRAAQGELIIKYYY